MEANDVILIKPMNLYNQKMTEDAELRLEFYDNHFKYICKFYAEEAIDKDDHSLGWETVYTDFELVVDKKSVAGFEKSWSHKFQQWCIYISVNGMSEDVKMFFKNEKESQECLDKLLKYFYS